MLFFFVISLAIKLCASLRQNVVKQKTNSNLLLSIMFEWMQEFRKCFSATFGMVTGSKCCASFCRKKLLEHYACSTYNIHPDIDKSNVRVYNKSDTGKLQ